MCGAKKTLISAALFAAAAVAIRENDNIRQSNFDEQLSNLRALREVASNDAQRGMADAAISALKTHDAVEQKLTEIALVNIEGETDFGADLAQLVEADKKAGEAFEAARATWQETNGAKRVTELLEGIVGTRLP